MAVDQHQTSAYARKCGQAKQFGQFLKIEFSLKSKQNKIKKQVKQNTKPKYMYNYKKANWDLFSMLAEKDLQQINITPKCHKQNI